MNVSGITEHSPLMIPSTKVPPSHLQNPIRQPLSKEKEFLKERESKLASLTPVQRRRFEQYKDGAKIADIARREGSAFNTVKESVEAAQKKLGKLL